MTRHTLSAVRPPEPRRTAFTLVELLVVIAIIATLIGLLLPAVQSVRESARRTQCSNNLRQLGLAIMNYESVRKVFPNGRTSRDPDTYGWTFRLLPYLEEQPIFDSSPGATTVNRQPPQRPRWSSRYCRGVIPTARMKAS